MNITPAPGPRHGFMLVRSSWFSGWDAATATWELVRWITAGVDVTMDTAPPGTWVYAIAVRSPPTGTPYSFAGEQVSVTAMELKR